MTDSDYETQKSRLQSLADKWINSLWLGYWRIDMRYAREGFKPKNASDAADGYDCAASTNVRWCYLEAFIDWNMPVLADFDDERLEYIFVHELCHILVHEMRGWAPNELSGDRAEVGIEHEERVVTTLARAFITTRKHGEEAGKTTAQPAQ